ncbi:MAG: TonB-dependent receptor [Acidobacteriota bacterium]
MNPLSRVSSRARCAPNPALAGALIPALMAALVLALIGALIGAPALHAQGVTTGALAGHVTAAEDGSALPGVVVEAVHQPTGTRYSTVSRADGRWSILNVRVGGPYELRATLTGFQPQEVGDVFVKLGESVSVDFTLQLETIEEELTVTASVRPLITPDRQGVATNVSEQAIEDLPSLDRSFQELARLSPFFTAVGDNDEETIVTVAGRNNRYNNIQIDGAINNDLFGLAATGTPGGQAQTQPISLDVIKEIALLVSPYDVRQGGFSGGGINAITRSGTNAFQGSAYWFQRDQDFVGDGPDDREIGEFSQDEYGFRLGGPIQRDRLFFFVNGERSERTQPSGVSADGSSGQSFVNPAGAAEFRNILVNQYGYDPGGLGEAGEERNSDKLFGRLDWNIADTHQLTLRHNYIDADNDVYRPSTFGYEFPDRNYDFTNETNSTVLQLNSTFGADKYNEARVTYQTIKDRRSGGEPFPAVTVELADGSDVSAGVEPFSTKNALDQDILEITDDFTWLFGDHTVTLGTHNEIFTFDNLFIRQAFGEYTFLGLDNFRAGKAFEFDRSFSVTGDPNQSAEFDVQQLGFYAGDQWAAGQNLTVTYGLRVDVPRFPDDPSFNQEAFDEFGYRTDEMPSGNEVWSPRVGFNWNVPWKPSDEWDHQLRGGVGIFTGRTPYVWLSNQYSNTGIEFQRIGSFIDIDEFDPNNNFIPFEPDPNNQPTDPGQIGGFPFTNEINVTDPDFEFPQVTRYTLGYDVSLPWYGLNLTAETIYADTRKEVNFQNINIVPTGETYAFDGRPLFERQDNQFRDVILLTNTERGRQWNTALKLTHPYRKGFYGSVSWLYGESRVVNDGTSSQARSNWRFNETKGDPNEPTLGVSDFDPGHRFNASIAYNFDLGPTDHTVSLFYNAQEGRPYSTIFFGDANGDGETGNDLFYVPASEDEVIIQGGTWEQLDAYIRGDDGLSSSRGEIVDRNASRAPWIHQLDFHYAVRVPFGRFEPEITLDIFNFGNLIDSDSGVVRFASFSAVSPVSFNGIDEATGKPIYGVSRFTSLDRRFEVDDLRSRWQAKLGLRFSF